MKATGIVRRVDDLGRIVIPREVRRKLNINEGDGMEIYLDEGKLVMMKYEHVVEPVVEEGAVRMTISDSTYDYLVGEITNKAIEMERLICVFDRFDKPAETYTYQEVELQVRSLSPEMLISLAADLIH